MTTYEEIKKQAAKMNVQLEFTTDLDNALDLVLKAREDYFLGLHSKVKEIIQREIDFCKGVYDSRESVKLSDWQKELFEYKFQIIEQTLRGNGDLAIISETKDDHYYLGKRLKELPNQHINLGLRKTNGKVGEWNLPEPIFLENLKSLCFPIDDWINLTQDESSYEDKVLEKLTEWYKTFHTIQYFEDFNDILSFILINVLSFNLTNKYIRL